MKFWHDVDVVEAKIAIKTNSNGQIVIIMRNTNGDSS